MTAVAHAPVVSPTWTSEDAVSVERTLAAHFAETASQRDAERILPGPELDRLSESGLLEITVPQEYGGPELPAVTLAEVFRILATGDPSIAQIPQSHFVYVNAMRQQGTPAQQEFFFGEVLAGKPALAQRAHAHAARPRGMEGATPRAVGRGSHAAAQPRTTLRGMT